MRVKFLNDAIFLFKSASSESYSFVLSLGESKVHSFHSFAIFTCAYFAHQNLLAVNNLPNIKTRIDKIFLVLDIQVPDSKQRIGFKTNLNYIAFLIRSSKNVS